MVLSIIYFKYNNKDLWSNEWKTMKQHSEIGHRITIATPQLEHIAEYILYHHERWDGAGYPIGLKGQEIPIISRISLHSRCL